MPKLTSTDGTTIAYDKKGQGPVLILVLGALNKRGSGKKLAALLAEDFTVICYDRRGRGDSTDTPPYTVDKEIDDLEALIDANGGKASLYGHSSGAVLALAAANQLGAKVARLVLYELPYNTDPAARTAARSYQEELLKLLAADARGEAVALFVKSVGVTDNQIAAMQKLPMWSGLTAMAPTLAYDTVALMEYYPALAIQSIPVPTLVLSGSASPGFMGQTAQDIAARLPHADVRVLDGQSHDVRAEALAPVLASFIAD